MRYWDSSALVPLLLKEDRSRQVQDLLQEDPVILTWWGTELECASAICRLEREDALEPAVAEVVRDRLGLLCAGWNEMEARTPVRETALRLLRVHTLRAADALQLAAAVVAGNFRPSSLEFVCLDTQLRQAAEREGFPLLPGRDPRSDS